MKSFVNKIIVLTIANTLIFSCSHSDPTPKPEPEEDSLSLEFNQKAFSNKSAEFTLDVTANCDWSFSVDAMSSSKVNFPRNGFEKGATKRGFQR